MSNRRINLSSGKKFKAGKIEKYDGEPFFLVELKLEGETLYIVLLDAIEKTFLSLGEAVKASVYSYLEKSGIEKSEIPFRIDDFQNRLEDLFGLGARLIEILIIKNLHEKIKMKYRNNGPRWVIPDLSIQEYISLLKISYENSN
jgi:hypothetical protein